MKADGTQKRRSGLTVLFKQQEHVQLDGKTLPFSTRILMTDCEEHRIILKSPESAWKMAEERERQRWREAERLVEK